MQYSEAVESLCNNRIVISNILKSLVTIFIHKQVVGKQNIKYKTKAKIRQIKVLKIVILAKTICVMIKISFIVIRLNQITFACHPTSLHTGRTIVHVLHLCTLVTPAHLVHLCTGYRGARFALFAMFLLHYLRGRSKERFPRGPNV